MIPGRHRIEFDRYGRGEAEGSGADDRQLDRIWSIGRGQIRADVPLERDWRTAGLDSRWLSRSRTREPVV